MYQIMFALLASNINVMPVEVYMTPTEIITVAPIYCLRGCILINKTQGDSMGKQINDEYNRAYQQGFEDADRGYIKNVSGK